jgi:predicted ArsR family transcriptional regulator
MDSPDRGRDVAAIALLDEPVRRRLYDFVVGQTEPVGRDAAAAATGINRALAAFHLDRLVEGGLLSVGYRRLTGRTGPGAGRPARVYSRSPREVSVSLPARDYERVAEIFATALEKLGATEPPAALRETAAALGAELGGKADGLLDVLTSSGYQPVVTEDGTVRLRNCPFDALVDEHRPLVCGTNLALAQGICSQVSTDLVPVIDQQPGYCCVAFVPGRDRR